MLSHFVQQRFYVHRVVNVRIVQIFTDHMDQRVRVALVVRDQIAKR